jgi:hypothetical protein
MNPQEPQALPPTPPQPQAPPEAQPLPPQNIPPEPSVQPLPQTPTHQAPPVPPPAPAVQPQPAAPSPVPLAQMEPPLESPVTPPSVAPPVPQQGVSNQPGASASNLKPVSPKLKNLFEQDADEVLIGQINKHPIGLVFIYGGALSMFLLVMVIVYFIFRIAPDSGFDLETVSIWIKLLFGLVGFFILLGGYIAGWVYQRSALILTSEKLVQLTQQSLFDRKISQLAIGDVQDVTVDQKGVLSRVFHYGSINIETSGEQYNYSFDYAPHPHDAAKEIVSAHERNVQLYGN